MMPGIETAAFIADTGCTLTFDHVPNDPESADIKASIGVPRGLVGHQKQ
jgi:hypothetical protein